MRETRTHGASRSVVAAPLRMLCLCLLVVGGLAACGDSPSEPGDGGSNPPPVGPPPSNEPPGPVDDPENFLWVFGKLHRDTLHYDNLLAFAARHDLSIILAGARLTQHGEKLAEIEVALDRAKSWGIPVLYNTGVFSADDGWPTGAVIVADSAARAAYVAALQRDARVYLDRYPGGRVIVGHEDPLFSNWPAGHEENYLENGAEMFRIQRGAVLGVDSTAMAGLFILPYDAVRMYRAFTPWLADVGSLPDFNMIDLYRGYSDPASGLLGTNEQLRDLLSEVRQLTEGAPTFYLGQDHTINNGYTPSKRAITQNADVALDEGVAGVGWYIRTKYVKTAPISTLGGAVEPFLPNTGEVEQAGYSTFTGDRDRFMFAYLTTFERQGRLVADERFDLWIHGSDLDLHEARLSLRRADGSWEFIGDIGTYVSGDNPYTLDGRTGAVVFHALDRATFLGSGPGAVLEARLEVGPTSDGLELHGIYALPYVPTDAYVTEPEAGARLADDAAGVAASALVHHTWDAPASLAAGETLEIR